MKKEAMKKGKAKHVVVPIPASLEEAAEFISRVGKEQREINQVQTKLNEKVEKLKAEAMAKSQIHETNKFQLVEGLFVFGESHREELTEGNKRKTVEVPTGLFCWRMTPHAVSLKDVEQVLNSLKSLGLNRFIRTKEEVDKEAMLKEKEVAKTVVGVSITQHEEFIVKPSELEVEIAFNVSKLKRVAA